jgi:hypothetical protein
MMKHLTILLLAVALCASMAGCGSESGRRDHAQAIMNEITAILDDHEAFGTEDEVANAIATHATEDAVMDDDVFGAYPYREGFYNTLYFGGADARIDVYASWLSEDGSQGGFLWMWSGTNPSGHVFELAGISLIEFAEDGRIAYERVTYPYPDEYVYEAWMGAGTGILSTG